MQEHENRFVCEKCGASYKHKNHLTAHIKTNCNQLKNFNCPMCPYKSYRISHVKHHAFKRHNKKL